jgi:hypothetical protein
VALLMMAVIVIVYTLYHRAVIEEARAIASEKQAQLQKDRAIASEQQAQLQKDLAIAARERAQLQEARAVSTLALHETERGDAMTGMLAALAILPKDLAKPDRPLSNAVSAALLNAWLCNFEKHDLILLDIRSQSGAWHSAQTGTGW